MTTEQSVQATCLCGAVTLSVAKRENKVGACHCGMCRKWVGGPLLSIDCGTEVSIDGAEHVTSYASSEWAERGFCKVCGSALFYKFVANQQYILPAGLFADENTFDFNHQIYIDKKPEYYDFANNTENMTEAEVLAKYAP